MYYFLLTIHKPKRCIVSPGQLVFVPDKKPASTKPILWDGVSTLSPVSFQRMPFLFYHCLQTVQQQLCENSKSNTLYCLESVQYAGTQVQEGSRGGGYYKGVVFTIESSAYLKHKAEESIECTGRGGDGDCLKRKQRLLDTHGWTWSDEKKGREERRNRRNIWLSCCLKQEYLTPQRVL